MFPDAMKTWVELFTPNKSNAEHYTQVIMSTLSDMSYFGKEKSVVPRKMRRGRRRQNEVSKASLDTDSSSDEDIDDDWRREASDNESATKVGMLTTTIMIVITTITIVMR